MINTSLGKKYLYIKYTYLDTWEDRIIKSATNNDACICITMLFFVSFFPLCRKCVYNSYMYVEQNGQSNYAYFYGQTTLYSYLLIFFFFFICKCRNNTYLPTISNVHIYVWMCIFGNRSQKISSIHQIDLINCAWLKYVCEKYYHFWIHKSTFNSKTVWQYEYVLDIKRWPNVTIQKWYAHAWKRNRR